MPTALFQRHFHSSHTGLSAHARCGFNAAVRSGTNQEDVRCCTASTSQKTRALFLVNHRLHATGPDHPELSNSLSHTSDNLTIEMARNVHNHRRALSGWPDLKIPVVHAYRARIDSTSAF